MTIANGVTFRHSVYYAFNTLPIIKQMKAKPGGQLDGALNAVFGFRRCAERMDFLRFTKPADLPLAGAVFANFSLALSAAAVSIIGTGRFFLGKGLDVAPNGEVSINGALLFLACCLCTLGTVVGTAAVDNFLENMVVPRLLAGRPKENFPQLAARRAVMTLVGLQLAVAGGALLFGIGGALVGGFGVFLLTTGVGYVVDQGFRFNGEKDRYLFLRG